MDDDQQAFPTSTWATTLLPVFLAIAGVLYAISLTFQSRMEPGANAMRLVEERYGRAVQEQLRAMPGTVTPGGWRARRVDPEGRSLFVVSYTALVKDNQGRMTRRVQWWEVNLADKSVREITGNRELETRYQRILTGQEGAGDYRPPRIP